MRANAGDFIIGEVGKIDINSGQTLEVIITNITSSFVKDIGKVGDFYRHTKNVLDLLF